MAGLQQGKIACGTRLAPRLSVLSWSWALPLETGGSARGAETEIVDRAGSIYWDDPTGVTTRQEWGEPSPWQGRTSRSGRLWSCLHPASC